MKDHKSIALDFETRGLFEPYDPDLIKFTVPIEGYYQVSERVTYFTPTGRYETVPNENRKWYEFWEPETITREIYATEVKHTGTKVVYLEKGETIETRMAYRL